jgi:hypothetical protein
MKTKVLVHCPCGDPVCKGDIDLFVFYDVGEWMIGRRYNATYLMGAHKGGRAHEFYVDNMSQSRCECGAPLPKEVEVTYRLFMMGDTGF